MICPVDPNGYCHRHKIVHVGPILELSQRDDEYGEAYRRIFDQVYLGKIHEEPSRVFGECRYLGSPWIGADGKPFIIRHCCSPSMPPRPVFQCKHPNKKVQMTTENICQRCPIYERKEEDQSVAPQ